MMVTIKTKRTIKKLAKANPRINETKIFLKIEATTSLFKKFNFSAICYSIIDNLCKSNKKGWFSLRKNQPFNLYALNLYYLLAIILFLYVSKCSSAIPVPFATQ